MSSVRHRRNFNEPGQAHELTFSCYRRFQFLRAERSCEWLRDAINDARVNWDFWLWAWVIMPEHVHLLVYPRQVEYEIADIRHDVKSPVGSKAIKWMKEHAPEWLPKITRMRGGRVAGSGAQRMALPGAE